MTIMDRLIEKIQVHGRDWFTADDARKWCPVGAFGTITSYLAALVNDGFLEREVTDSARWRQGQRYRLRRRTAISENTGETPKDWRGTGGSHQPARDYLMPKQPDTDQ